MFFQGLIYLAGVILFGLLFWKWVVIPFLKENDIPYEEQKTEYTKKLDRLKEEYRRMETSTRAAEEGVKLMADIKTMEAMISECDRKMQEME